jgi:hypothetical protein
MGNISPTNDRAVNSHQPWAELLRYHNGSRFLVGYCYKIKSENIAFQIDPYKIRCLKSDFSRVFIVFITGLISCKVSNKNLKQLRY